MQSLIIKYESGLVKTLVIVPMEYLKMGKFNIFIPYRPFANKVHVTTPALNQSAITKLCSEMERANVCW